MKTCIQCAYFFFDEGSPHYSEYTPGYDSELRCIKEHWRIDNYECSTEAYRNSMMKAETCKDFKHYKEQKQ